jgi:hypothetical protein
MTIEELKKWRNFRTYNWKKSFPAPDMAIRQIKELLSLVELSGENLLSN